MTQYFTYQRFKLWRAPFQTRVLLTLFNGMIVLATGVGILMYRVRTGLSATGARDYYLGNEGTASAGKELQFARSFKELLDVTHDHAFSQPFLFFVLCHIFALTRVSDRLKITVYVASFGSVLIDLASPFVCASPGGEQRGDVAGAAGAARGANVRDVVLSGDGTCRSRGVSWSRLSRSRSWPDGRRTRSQRRR